VSRPCPLRNQVADRGRPGSILCKSGRLGAAAIGPYSGTEYVYNNNPHHPLAHSSMHPLPVVAQVHGGANALPGLLHAPPPRAGVAAWRLR
jgi:hypothetical protein